MSNSPASWTIRGSELVLTLDGQERVLPAEEIYGALVERRPTRDEIPTSVEGLKASRYPLRPSLNLFLADGTDLPSFSLTGISRGTELPVQLDDLRRGHLVAEGVWYPVDEALASDILELHDRFGIEVGPARSLRAFLAARRAASDGLAVSDQLGTHTVPALAFTVEGGENPRGVDAVLYPYQLSGWKWLKFLLGEGIGGLLADEMGLGKTLQIISVLSDSGAGTLSPSLIIAPGSLLENWRREFARFAPALRVLKHQGSLRTGRPADLADYDVVVTSYDSAVSDQSLLNMIDWKVIVLDEAQYIRNPDAQRTKAVKHLRRQAGLAVTGTPVENRLMDLWSIMDFVAPGHLGDSRTFEKNFPDDFNGAALLEPHVSPLMLRRRVSEVATDLPARIDIPQFIELDEVEASAYDAARDQIAEQYGAAATLVALTSLRRFCAHPALLGGSAATDPLSFSKFRRFEEILQEIFARGEKVIVFTSFTAMADIIAAHIQKRHGAFAGVIDGRLSIEERQPLIDRFGQVIGAAALVLNPIAGGSGLNITAANHVIHYNLEWNPAAEDQASARAYRRGQELPVTVHRLIVADTVEEVVNDRLARKRSLSQVAVVGVEGRDEDYDDVVSALSRSPLSRGGRK